MKTYEIRIKIAGGNKSVNVNAENIMDAFSKFNTEIVDRLSELGKSCLEEIEIKEAK